MTKTCPTLNLSFFNSPKNMSLIIAIAGINALVGGVIGINQAQIRTVIAYSSIGHLG